MIARDGDEVAGDEPEPHHAAVVTDLVEKTLNGLDGSYVEVFQLRVQGCTETEIAKQLGSTRGAVRYKLQRIRDRLEILLQEPGC